jgi:hypothetical protein
MRARIEILVKWLTITIVVFFPPWLVLWRWPASLNCIVDGKKSRDPYLCGLRGITLEDPFVKYCTVCMTWLVILGAAYLVYRGIRSWREERRGDHGDTVPPGYQV